MVIIVRTRPSSKMKIIISALHADKSKEIKEYAEKKVKKLEKFHKKIEEINVRLISRKSHRGQDHDYYCEIEIAVPGHVLEIVDVERSMDKAIDKAYERMKRALVKHKEKHISKDHKRGVVAKVVRRLRRS